MSACNCPIETCVLPSADDPGPGIATCNFNDFTKGTWELGEFKWRETMTYGSKIGQFRRLSVCLFPAFIQSSLGDLACGHSEISKIWLHKDNYLYYTYHSYNIYIIIIIILSYYSSLFICPLHQSSYFTCRFFLFSSFSC